VVQRPDIFGTAFGANLVIMLTSIAAALALAALSYAWVERPFIALGRRLADRMPRLALQRSEVS
jgi:peptidoglycan/LPS O-acetylase OafA/YrhL